MSRSRSGRRAAGAALLALVALVAARPAQSPARVVSLVPAATEVLFALGGGDRVVGVSSYDRWPPEVESLPRVGSLLDPDAERILSLRPELVVVDPSQRALVRQLESVGIRTLPWATAGLEGFYERTRELGDALGLEASARELVERLRDELRAVAAGASGSPRPRTLLVFGRRPGGFSELWVNGGVGFLHDLTEIAGGRNVFGGLELQSFKTGLETLVADPPDVVVEVVPDEEAVHVEALAAEWRSLPGFAEVAVGVIVGSDALVPGPRMGATARELAAIVSGALSPR